MTKIADTKNNLMKRIRKYHIKNGGTLIIEHGKDQKKDIFDIFNTNSWKNINCIEDLRGFPRLTMAKYAT